MTTEAFLPRASFSTDGVSPNDRFAAWREALAGSHEIRGERDAFFGRLTMVQVDSLRLSVLDSAPISLERSTHQIRRDGHDHFVLHLSRHPIRAQAADAAVAIPAGGISVNDLSRRMRREAAPETGSIAAAIPRATLREVMGDCDSLHGQSLAGGAGLLLATHLRHLVGQAATIPSEAAPDLARATACLVAAALRPTGSTLGEARPAIEAAKLVRAHAFIDANLARPDLSPAVIGRAVGLSRSALFRLFEPEGGVSAFIWARRLGAVRRALLDPSDDRAIAQIGYAFGFASNSHLARAFRREFGMSPSNLRRG